MPQHTSRPTYFRASRTSHDRLFVRLMFESSWGLNAHPGTAGHAACRQGSLAAPAARVASRGRRALPPSPGCPATPAGALAHRPAPGVALQPLGRHTSTPHRHHADTRATANATTSRPWPSQKPPVPRPASRDGPASTWPPTPDYILASSRRRLSLHWAHKCQSLTHPLPASTLPGSRSACSSVVPAAGATFQPCSTYHASIGVSRNGRSAGQRPS